MVGRNCDATSVVFFVFLPDVLFNPALILFKHSGMPP